MTGHPVNFVVRRHKGGHAGFFHGRNEGRKEDFAEFPLGQIHRRRVDAAERLAAGDQVLRTSQNMVLAINAITALKAPDQVFSHFRHQQRVFPIGLAHTAPTGIAGNVKIGGEGPIHPRPTHLLRRFGPNLLHHLRMKGRGHVDIRWIDGASLVEGIPVDGIHAQQEGNSQAALRCDALQAGRFLAGKDVQERTHLPLADFIGHIGMAEVLIGRIHVPMRGTLSRRNVARTYILAHLTDLFFERHL